MKKVFTLVLTGAALSLSLAQPAAAAGRPTDGCAAAYTLTPISVLQELAQEAPDEYFVDLDVNGDGLLCNKFLPDASINVGLARDNFVAGY
ncbi:MAG TPA: hypothetical protein VF635_08730 [Propionibacteriaceae bacterium]|jgi:hypothetical protein